MDARGLTTTFSYSGTLLTSRTDALGRTTVYTYGSNNLLVAEQDPLGHVTRYAYNQFGQRTTVTDTLGNVTTFAYDQVGRLITTTDSLGRVTVNTYDNGNNLIRVMRNYLAGQPQNWQNEYNLVTQYAYDGAGRQILITGTLGHVMRNEYDQAGQLVTVTQNYLPGQPQNHLNQYNLISLTGYDAAGNVITRTDTLGRMAVTRYDSHNRPITVTTNYVDGIFDPTRPDEDISTSTGYDAAGNVITQTDALGRITRTWYDSLNRPISVTANYSPTQPQNYLNQYNLITRYGHDQVGNRVLVTDTLGQVTRTDYDALNRLLTVTQNYLAGQPQNYQNQYNLVTTYGYDAAGRQVVVTNTLGRATTSQYDDLNRLVAQVDAAGNRTEYGYNSLGNRTVMTDALGNVTLFGYDALNRVVTTTHLLDGVPITTVVRYDALGNRIQTTDGRGNTTQFGYDALNRNVVITDAKSHTTTIAYDALGRRTSQMDGLGHTTVYTYDLAGRQVAIADPLSNVTRYGYDVLGNRVVMTDANGIATRYEYDALNRASAVTENYTGAAQTADRDVRTTYTYDPVGNRTVITNARGYTTTFTYDALNRLATQSDALGNATRYVYDPLGNRTVMTDANSEVTLYAYDVLNRLTTITYTADATTVKYAYDKVGNRTIMTDSVGVTRYTYDDLYRLTNVVDPYSQAITYTYDAVGNRTKLIYPDGGVVTYTYDTVNLMSAVVDWSGGTTAYAYDAANRLITTTLPNGVRSIYTYNDADRLTRLTHTRNSGSETVGDYQFALDKVGNRTAVTETLLSPGGGAGGLGSTLGKVEEPQLGMSSDDVVLAVTGQRAPGMSALSISTETSAPFDASSAPTANDGSAEKVEVVGQTSTATTLGSLDPSAAFRAVSEPSALQTTDPPGIAVYLPAPRLKQIDQVSPGEALLVYTSRPTVMADGVDAALVGVVALDADRRPLPDGTPVAWTATLGSLTPISTGLAHGVALARFVGGQALGEATITAQIGAATSTVRVSIVAVPVGPDGAPDVYDEAAELKELMAYVRTTIRRDAVGRLGIDAAAHGVVFEAGRMVFTPNSRHGRDDTASFTYQLTGVRAGSRVLPLGASPVVSVTGNTLSYARGSSVVEWYTSRRDGLEQGFTFAALPPLDGDLVIFGAFATRLRPELVSQREGILFRDPASGRRRLALRRCPGHGQRRAAHRRPVGAARQPDRDSHRAGVAGAGGLLRIPMKTISRSG